VVDYRKIARDKALKYGLDPSLFVRQIGAESGFNPRAVSSAGALGIAQIMPATARGWGVDPRDPVASLDAAARAMSKYVRDYGGWKNALVAYNAGPGRVGKPLFSETRHYIDRVMGGRVSPVSGGMGSTGSTGASQDVSGLERRLAVAGLYAGRGGGSPLLFQKIEAARPAPGTFTGLSTIPSHVPAGPMATGWKDLQRIGMNRFGLRNDPGTSQTIGGRHTAGSEHYAGRAIDFGTALNSPAQLNAALKWFKKHGYDAIHEGDHIHVSLPGGSI
jgi:hypothetical protein